MYFLQDIIIYDYSIRCVVLYLKDFFIAADEKLTHAYLADSMEICGFQPKYIKE